MPDVVIVTGGTRGLGRATVDRFLQEGWHVATCGSNAEHVRELNAASNARLLARQLDVADEAAVRGFVQEVEHEFVGINILINNAAIIGERSEIATYDPEVWRRVMDVNLNSLLYFSQSVLPGMMSRREGVIINVTSGAGVSGSKRWGAYAASKFALEGFTQVLHQEVEDRHIRVHSFDPGRMRTEMRARAYPNEDPNTVTPPELVARVLFDVAAVYEPKLVRLDVAQYL